MNSLEAKWIAEEKQHSQGKKEQSGRKDRSYPDASGDEASLSPYCFPCLLRCRVDAAYSGLVTEHVIVPSALARKVVCRDLY